MDKLDNRKEALLETLVREYVKTAEPVGSLHLARRAGLEVSSATVRNELAELEEAGYLVQPHTSAGRVPTELAYRYFIEHLAHHKSGQIANSELSEVCQFLSYDDVKKLMQSSEVIKTLLF